MFNLKNVKKRFNNSKIISQLILSNINLKLLDFKVTFHPKFRRLHAQGFN